MKTKMTFCLVFLSLLSVPSNAAVTPAQKGLSISKKAKDKDSGWKDYIVSVEMVLKTAKGKESRRYFSLKHFEESKGNKSLLVINRPNDVKGTAVLTHTHKDSSDDQWLFLPAVKRVKRISSTNRSGPFLGSEFAYEDISFDEVEKYTYKYLKAEPCKKGGKLQCHVLERYPKDKSSSYSKQIVWYDSKDFRKIRIDFFNRRGSRSKVLQYAKFKKYLGKFWRSHRMLMKNLETGKSTELLVKDYKFKRGYTPRDFETAALKRVR